LAGGPIKVPRPSGSPSSSDGKHHRSLVSGRREDEALHDGRVADDDRLVRLIHLDRTFSAPTSDGAQPPEGEAPTTLTTRGLGEEPLRDAVPRLGPTVAFAVLHHGGHEQTLGNLEEEDPATTVEVQRVQHRRGSGRLLLLRMTAGWQELRRARGRHPGVELTRASWIGHAAESRESPLRARFPSFSLPQLGLLGDAPGDTAVRLSTSPTPCRSGVHERGTIDRCVRGSPREPPKAKKGLLQDAPDPSLP
jgi:hypothetical protein